MPKLVRLYIINVAIGFAIAVPFVAMLIWLDVANLRHLVFGSDMGAVAFGMMVMFHGVVFAGVQFGIAVMRMAETDDKPRGGLRQHNVLVPVRVAAPAQKRR